LITLTSIVYRPRNAQASAEGYTREPLKNALLVAGHGIEGDAKAGGCGRNLNIMSAEVLEQLAAEGFVVGPGRMGEQLILSGIDVNSLPVGARLQIGETARVELTGPRTGCAKLERHQGISREVGAGRIGMMARVEAGGRIAVGDAVTVLEG
jgi:MOSC domain-containing protein YiiM